MRVFRPISLPGFLTQVLWLWGTSRASTHQLGPDAQSSSDLDSWIAQQAERSWSHTLANISPAGALPGVVVASLSTSKPDYFYSWTRDSAIVLKELVGRYETSHNPKLLESIKQSIAATQAFQRSSFDSYAGVGEPKYFVNGSAFTGPWGRPQRDGPALRATVYIRFALAYLSYGGQDALNYVKDVLYDGEWKSRSVIKGDLEYISNTWNEKSFDLWEEVNGFHFFTFSVIHRALRDGSKFAEKMNDEGAARWYEKQAGLIGNQLETFWDNQAGYIRVSRDVEDDHGKTSGLDVGTLLGCLHAGTQIPLIFRPQSKMMVDTFHAILKSMDPIYPINARYRDVTAKAVGRYPEDIYDGVGTSIGNPWFITTLTMAEYLYRLDEDQSADTMTMIAQKSGADEQFSRNFYDRSRGGSLNRSIADQFVAIAKNSILPNGSIPEQFHRVNGRGLGARDLTWSHVAFLSMARARNHLPPF